MIDVVASFSRLDSPFRLCLASHGYRRDAETCSSVGAVWLGSDLATYVDMLGLAMYVAYMKSLHVAEVAADTSDPLAGLRAVASLRALTERLELAQVEAGLRAGLSWRDIAAALGVTRQAVHRKYSKRIDPTIPVPRRNR